MNRYDSRINDWNKLEDLRLKPINKLSKNVQARSFRFAGMVFTAL